MTVEKLKTGIYVRVSTEEQAREGFSIRAQQEKLAAYAKLKDWEVYKIYSDEGISGKNIKDRSAINELIADIKGKRVNNVLIFKVDRLTRSTKDLMILLECFNENDCAFNSLTESIDTHSASGRMFLKIIGIFAEFERENIIERTIVGNEKKAREGYSVCKDVASLGYQREKGELVQTIFEEEAVIVREIFSMYLFQHKSFHRIACELNTKGVKTKMGKAWESKSIKKLLTNANYAGRIRYSLNDNKRYFEVPGRHEAIIDEETYEAVQAKIKKVSKKITTKWPREDNCFAGTLECALCGRKLSPKGKYKLRKDGTYTYIGYYACTGKSVHACTAKGVGHKKLEDAFRRYIGEIQDLNVLDKVDINENKQVAESEALLPEYEKNLERLDKKEREIMSIYISGQLPYDEYTSMMKMIKTEKAKFEKLISEIKTAMAEDEVSLRPEDIVLSIRENWDNLTKKEKTEFIHTYIERIVILNEAQGGENEGNLRIEKVDFYTK